METLGISITTRSLPYVIYIAYWSLNTSDVIIVPWVADRQNANRLVSGPLLGVESSRMRIAWLVDFPLRCLRFRNEHGKLDSKKGMLFCSLHVYICACLS